jgi:hypothetical protein
MSIVLRLDAFGGTPVVQFLGIESAPIKPAVRWAPFQLNLAALPPLQGDLGAQEYGRAIYAELTKHSGVKELLADLRRRAEKVPIYLWLNTTEGELLCWEALHDNGTYLALERWPISRIAREVNSAAQGLPYEFEGSLRLMAILSAYGIRADKQAAQLCQAVAAARAQGLAVELHMVVGEEDLLDALKRQAGPGDTLAPLQGTGYDLLGHIQRFRPHLLHFFCHGRSTCGEHLLEMATIRDRDAERGAGSVQLRSGDLLNSPVLKNVWLVALNCCKMSQAVGEVRSLTHALVADGGVPAAVGMLEPIDAEDADAFCGYFYADLLTALGQRLGAAADGADRVIEWADALSGPRRGLRARSPVGGARPPWTLPVLYVRGEPFMVRCVAPRSDRPRVQVRNDFLAGLARLLTAYPEARAQRLRGRLEEYLQSAPKAGAGESPAPA